MRSSDPARVTGGGGAPVPQGPVEGGAQVVELELEAAAGGDGARPLEPVVGVLRDAEVVPGVPFLGPLEVVLGHGQRAGDAAHGVQQPHPGLTEVVVHPHQCRVEQARDRPEGRLRTGHCRNGSSPPPESPKAARHRKTCCWSVSTSP